MAENPRTYTSSFDHLRDLLERVRLLLLVRMRALELIDSQQERGGPRVVQFLLENAEAHRVPRDPELAVLLDEVEATVQARCEATGPGLLRWNLVTERFRLSPMEELILLACVAPSFSTGFEHAFLRTGADFSGGRVPLTFLADLLSAGDEERWAILRALHPSSRLVTSGLVTLAENDVGTPLVGARVGPSPLLFDFLLEQPLGSGRPAVLRSVCDVVLPRPLDSEPPQALVEEFEGRVLAREAFVVRGSGAESLEGVAAPNGLGLVCVDWIPDELTPWNHEIYCQVALLARLYGLIPVLDLRGRREAPEQSRTLLFLQAMTGMARVVAAPSSNWKGSRLWSLKLPVLGKEA